MSSFYVCIDEEEKNSNWRLAAPLASQGCGRPEYIRYVSNYHLLGVLLLMTVLTKPAKL
jgi:hypothetical protein